MTARTSSSARTPNCRGDLNERGIGSYIELIWPLPGETLASFKAGVAQLCERNAASIIVYAHLLLHNTPIQQNRESLGLVTRRGYDDAAEADIIVQTREVNYDDFRAGMWFIYAINALHNTHVLQALGSYLNRTGQAGYADLLDAFTVFAQTEPDHPYTRFCAEFRSKAPATTTSSTIQRSITWCCTGERAAFADLWRRFCEAQPWWSDANARLLFELDVLGKPFLYRNTSISETEGSYEFVTVSDRLQRGCVVEVPETFVPVVHDHVRGLDGSAALVGPCSLRIEHPRIPYPYNPDKSEEDIADYCSGMITRIMSILPTRSRVSA